MNTIDNVHLLAGELSMLVRDVRALWKDLAYDTPEDNFLQDAVDNLDEKAKLADRIRLDDLAWYGSLSGESYPNLLLVLGRTSGSAELGLVWSSGDITGLAVCNGQVTEHAASIVLGERTGGLAT